MNNKQSLTQQFLKEQLSNNQNPVGFKLCIADVLKGVQNRAYWYFTSDQAEFLSNVYVKEVQQQTLRNRLKQITDEGMDFVFSEIMTGQLYKMTVQHEQLVTTVKILQKVQTIAAQGNDYYTADHPLARQNVEKIKLISEDYKQFKQRVDQVKQKQRERKLQKEEMQKEIQEKIAEERKLEYHKQVMKRLEIMKLKQEQRIEQNQKFKLFLKDFKKAKPLHILMEEEFKEKIELPQLQEGRKKLQLYKHKKKPTLEQINDHERAFMTLKQSRPEKTFVKSQTIDVGYKSEFYKKIQEEDKIGYDDEYSSGVWDQMEKKKRYSLMVKENFKPKASRLLQNMSVDESRQRNSQKKIAPDNSRVKQIGKFYLQYVKSLEKNRSNSATIEKQQYEQQQNRISRSRYTNYLEQLKQSNDGKLKGMGSNWQQDFNDRTASKSQRRDRVLIKSKQLEEKAMRDEMLIMNNHYGKAEEIIGKKKEIDETLLSAIKAKMALLKEVRDG